MRAGVREQQGCIVQKDRSQGMGTVVLGVRAGQSWVQYRTEVRAG